MREDLGRVAPVLSERLELASIGPGLIEALLRGDVEAVSREMDVEMPAELVDGQDHVLRLRLDQLRADPAVQPWLLRLMLPRQESRRPRPALGRIGFHGPPDADARVEVGYTVVSEHRGRGYATEACGALFAWARERGVTRFRASVSPANAPSLAVVRKLGFRQTGTQWDEIDGEELVFERGP